MNREIVMLEDHTGGAGDLGDFDSRCERAGLSRDRPVLAGRAAEVAKLEGVVGCQGRSHISSQPSTRLQSHFEQESQWHAVLSIGLEVPGIRQDVVLGLGRAARDHDPGFRIDPHDSIEELVGRTGQA